MPQGTDRPSGDKREERDQLLTKVLRLAPLFAVILQLLELTLKLLGVIR